MAGTMDGRRIARAREERGLSRRELARRAKVSVATVHNVETRKVRPRGSTLRKILGALQRTPKLPLI
jgi:transcriptional regulator with XRE-family HTH domain